LHKNASGFSRGALSGFGGPADLKASETAGFDAHLVKPVDLSKLQQLIGPLVPH
jgi:CheY-like chemotaxis protein